MLHKVKELLDKKNVEYKNFPVERLYKAGMDNIRDNIEYYFDKTYTCESVLQELFVRGMISYIEKNN
jgi:hypothetical protein